MNIWFDFTNPPHVNFFNPLRKKFLAAGYQIQCTARDFVETIDLLKLNDIEFAIYGKHGGRKKSKKILALVDRIQKLSFHVKSFDASFSSNNEAPFISWIKRKPAFVFDDNDISPNWLYSKFARYVVSPAYIDKKAMYRMGISPGKLITYNGFKENIYIADYKPDPDFLQILPFDNFVTVRPENIQAAYVPHGVRSIVPDLIKKLTTKGINVLYLPRYESDRNMIEINERVFIPSKPLNGLDVCYYSNAVLTGAGSFSREAALMGTPAVSYFAGNEFLGVDKEMFAQKLVFFSRDPGDITEYVINSSKKEFDIEKSKTVQRELFSILDRLMKETI